MSMSYLRSVILFDEIHHPRHRLRHKIIPMTKRISKQRLPMYVKPMVNDSFSELMRAGESQMKHER